MDRRISALLANVTVASAALLGGGCFVVDTEHLDDLRNGGADAGMSDAQMPDEDSGTGGEQLNDACGGDIAEYIVLSASTTTPMPVSTRGLSNRISSCGSRDAPGNDGFIAIQVQAGEKWHFHVIPDPSVEDNDRDPFLYLLDSRCRNTACEHSSDACVGSGDEHFAFVAPTGGTWYLGIDDRMAGGGDYLVGAYRLFCDGGEAQHGEACDGSATCNIDCREILDESRSSEQLPNDNEIEANFLEFPATQTLTISGDIGGGNCTYPDVYNFSVANDSTRLVVDILKTDGSTCDSGSLTPFDIVLRNSAGEVRASAQTNATTGCSELRVDGLDAANYFLYLEHDEPLERLIPYRLRITQML